VNGFFNRNKSLLDICEALGSVKSKHTESLLVLREKLLQTLDAFVMQYGGVAFFAPLDIQSNSSIGARRKTDTYSLEEMEFIDYVWSTSTESYVSKMTSFGLSSPKLSKAPLFRTVLLSRRYMVMNMDKVVLPENHFSLETALLIPVVINKQSVAMLGLGNGKYTNMDASILFEILPKIWTDVILESVARANKKHEDTVRLQNVEKRVEFAKSMLLKLNNVMKNDDEEIVGMSREKYLRKKLLEMANFFEEEVGGLVFVAPTKVEININLLSLSESSHSGSGSSGHSGNEEKAPIDPFEFMTYVFSNSGRSIRKTVMKKFKKPVLKNSELFMKAVTTKEAMFFPDTSKMKLPQGHFPMSSVLLVPIVVNLECCGLVGIANGKTDKLIGDVLFDVLSTSWFTILQQCFSRIDLKNKERSSKIKDFEIPNRKKGTITKVTSSKNSVLVILKITGIFKICKLLNADSFLGLLNSFYSKFDVFLQQCDLQKVDTVSEYYIGGVGFKDSNVENIDASIQSCANFALAAKDLIDAFNNEEFLPDELKNNPFGIKIAITSGLPLLTGLIGTSSYKYDLFGELLQKTKLFISKSPSSCIVVMEGIKKILEEHHDFEQLESVGDEQLFNLKNRKIIL
jgi:hypothetical protein